MILRACSRVRLGLVVLLMVAALLAPGAVMPEARAGGLVVGLLAGVGAVGVFLLRQSVPPAAAAAWSVVLVDAGLVTALVGVTGAPRTLFNALYVLTIVTASLLLTRAGALVIAGLVSVLNVGLLAGRDVLSGSAPAERLDLLTVLLNAATFLMVAVVAGGLTDRIRASERQLRTQREDIGNLQAVRDLIFDSVTSGLVTIDRDRRITAFNRAAEVLTGVTAALAVGRPWQDVVGTTPAFESIEAELDGDPGAAIRIEVERQRTDGGSTPMRVTFSALRSSTGERLGLIGVCEDLDRLRHLETAARQADRLASLGRMAANMAHEIRNPLASLTGAIDALSRPAAPADARHRLVQIVMRESDRLNGIIRDFLQYARPAPLDRKAGNVAEALDDVLVLLQHRPLPAGLRVVRDYPSDLPWRFDTQQLRQAVWNLCLNAVDAMPEGGELRVMAAAAPARLTVRVSDTGHGIEADDVGQVFEPFFSTKPGEPGLGLALTHRIVKDHGGEIAVTTTPGAGTAFTLTLPRGDG